MKRVLIAIALWLASCAAALAQPVTVIGPITPGDCPQFSSTTVIKDGGFNCNGGAGLVVGTSTVTGGSNGAPLFNNSGFLGNGLISSTWSTFLQIGTGAVTRTVQSKLQDTINAADFGVKCDGVTTTDAANTQLAINAALALGGSSVVLPAGTCLWTKKVFYNSFAAPGTLTVPGIKLVGQGRGVTKIDTRVANDYAIATNPDWAAAHKANYSAAAGSSGTLATNTYYIQITMNDGLGNEVRVGLPKSISVTGTTGSVAMTLPAVDAGYTYNVYFDTASTPAHFATVSGGNASALPGNQTITITAIGGAQAFPVAKTAVWQEASIQNLSIINSAATVGASGVLYFRTAYSDITSVYMNALTGDGLDIPNWTGDVDGAFNVSVRNSKFDTIAGWCINAAGNTLEFSNFLVEGTVFNVCGTQTANLNTNIVMTAITNANPGVVTTTSAHNLSAKDQVYINNVAGMSLATGWYRACGTVSGSTFSLCDLNGNNVDTTSLGAYTASSGTEALAWRPPLYSLANGTISGSGAIAYVGLISTWRNLDFTQNNVTDIYFSEAGASDNATFEGIDLENTAGKGLYIAALSGGNWNQGECLSSTGLGNTISCAQLGTGFNAGGVKNFNIAHEGGFKVRSNVTPAAGFELFQNTANGATFQNTVRIGSKIDWQSFDAAGQTRFNGFVFDPIPGQVQFSISAQNTVKLVPIGYGGCLPLHLIANGEWVCYQVPSVGLTMSVTGGLAATTQYSCYVYNSSVQAAPYALSAECNATSTALDQGYRVKSGDSTRTFVGAAVTDGSGNFQTTGAQVSQYPIQVASPLALNSGGAVTCTACVLISGTGHGDSAYNILPTDRYVYTNATFTAARTWNLPAANSVSVGTTIWVQDAQATVTSTNTLTVSRAGSDTINISSTTLVITGSGGGITFTSDGISNWGTPIQTVSTGGTGKTTLTAHGVVIGEGVNPVAVSAAGATGQFLQGQTGADPVWSSTSQIPGTTTNDNANTGNVGEIVSAGGATNSTTFTVTIAAPAVVTFPTAVWTQNCTGNGTAPFVPTTTGVLPTGLTSGTTVWIICSTVSGNTTQIATSLDNAVAGTAITTTGSQSGTHTATSPAMTTSTTLDLAGVRIGAGDWEVNETVYANPAAATSITDVSAYLSLVANTPDVTPGKFSQIQGAAFVPGAGAVVSAAVPPYRFSLSAATTIRCDAVAIFTVSTMTGNCFIKAIRAR